MTQEEAHQLLEQLRQLPDDDPGIDQVSVAEWIVALNDPDDRLIERKLVDMRLKRTDSLIAQLIAGLREEDARAAGQLRIGERVPAREGFNGIRRLPLAVALQRTTEK